MSDDTQFSLIIDHHIQWDRLSMIPATYRNNKMLGHLGLVDQQLVFKPFGDDPYDFQFNLADITYFSLLPLDDDSGSHPLLTVHDNNGEEWLIHVFELTLDRLHDFTRRLLHIKPDAPLAPHPDLGPAKTLLYEQNIYGEWRSKNLTFPMRRERNQVYLAPDRLLLSQVNDLLVDHIVKLTLISETSRPILRIDYRLPADPDSLQHIGLRFIYEDAETWAINLLVRTGVPLERIEKRKKKSD